MKKLILCSFVIAAIIVYNTCVKDDSHSLIVENVEALTEVEQTDHYWCCGNTEVCAKGDNLTIRGKLSTTPCE